MENWVRELMGLARDRICRDHPYLALALERLEPVEDAGVVTVATDGARMRCNPQWAREAFLQEEGRLGEALFHALAHCLLGHIFAEAQLDWALELACDFQARQLAAESAPELFKARRDGRFLELNRRFGDVQDVRALAESMAGDDYVLKNRDGMRSMLHLDDHSLWAAARGAERERRACGGEGLEAAWRRSARCLRRGAGGQAVGREAGARSERMRLQPGPRQEFAAALSRYADLRENARVDPDSFQYAWYLYGMEALDGAPILEPLEYREERGIAALAIVIDTSGSCARGLTQRFLELTRDILLEKGLFFRRFELHILQCDAKVQRDDRITSFAEFERYIENLVVTGGGGTDFRPAIRHIDRLVAEGTLPGLKGALYFSDGRGIFPAQPPEYELTFVFLKHRYDDIDVPGWVRRLVIDAPVPRGGEYYEY